MNAIKIKASITFAIVSYYSKSSIKLAGL